MPSKKARWQRIRELLGANQISSQEQLQAMLRAKGIEVTQATLSRDLRELGVLKGPEGYQLPGTTAGAGVHGNGTSVLERVLPSELLSAEAGGNLIVLRTQPAHANPLAIEIDKAQLPQVMGTIAGDDAVFVAARTSAQAARVLKMFKKMAGMT